MNPRIKCSNCIYWEEPHCILLPDWVPDVGFKETPCHWYCGHFIDKETRKSYSDLYFEEKCKCKELLPDVDLPDGFRFSHSPFGYDKSKCKIHGEVKE